MELAFSFRCFQYKTFAVQIIVTRSSHGADHRHAKPEPIPVPVPVPVPVLCCAVLYCTVLYCTVPYGTVGASDENLSLVQ